MKRLAMLLVLSCVSLATAGPMKFTANGFAARDSIITGPVYKQIKVTIADVNPKAGLVWRYDEKKLDIRFCDKRKREAFVTGPVGTYRIEVMSVQLAADGNTDIDQGFLTLTITPGVDDPVVPVDPVVPPKPKPVDPVVPTDPLIRSLQDAYNMDKEANKAMLKASLANTFRAAREDAVLDKARSTAALFDVMEAANAAAGIPGKITATKGAVAAYLKTKIKGVDYPITKPIRDSIKSEFAKIADSLDAVK